MKTLTDDWRFSFSQLQQYSGCSEKYRIMVMEEERPQRQPAAWLVHGNALHNSVAEWHMTGMKRDLQTLYQEAYEKELELQVEKQPNMALWNLTPRVKSVDQDLKLRKAAGFDQIQAYEIDYAKGEWVMAEDGDDMLCEISFEIKFGIHNVRGFLDQVRYYPKTDTHKVIDLKTGAAAGTDPRQLGLYGEAMKQLYGLDIKWGQFWYSKLDSVPKSGDKLGRYSDNYLLNTFDAKYWLEEYTMMRKGIDNGVFLPSPGDNCRTCDALTLCRAKPYL